MKVFLRALNKSDCEKIYTWLQDEEIQSLTGGDTFYPSTDYINKWIEDKIFGTKEIYLAICLSANKEMIGYLSIKDIDHRNRKAVWGGILIGEKDLWNQGLATEAARLMLAHVFNELNINLLWAFWREDHISSVKMGEKIGFKKVGILPQGLFKRGEYNNMVIMCLLRQDYVAADNVSQ